MEDGVRFDSNQIMRGVSRILIGSSPPHTLLVSARVKRKPDIGRIIIDKIRKKGEEFVQKKCFQITCVIRGFNPPPIFIGLDLCV